MVGALGGAEAGDEGPGIERNEHPKSKRWDEKTKTTYKTNLKEEFLIPHLPHSFFSLSLSLLFHMRQRLYWCFLRCDLDASSSTRMEFFKRQLLVACHRESDRLRDITGWSHQCQCTLPWLTSQPQHATATLPDMKRNPIADAQLVDT